jgi:hypothetical protein
MHLIENTPFLGVHFAPDINLDFKTKGIRTEAIWDFYVSEFDVISIRLQADVNEFRPHSDSFWLVFSVGAIAIILVPIVVKIA